MINKDIKNCSIRIMLAISLLAGITNAYYGVFQIGDEPVNPRVCSMGSAGTANAGGGFCFYNPASPAFAPAPFLTCEYGELPGTMPRALIETAWMFPKWFAGASMRVHTTDFGVTTEQTDDPDHAPLSSNQMMQGTVTGGFTFGSKRFASGHSVNFFQQRIGDKVYRSWTYSLGVIYRLVPGSVTLGASMLNYARLDTVRTPWYNTPRGWYEGAWDLPRYVRAGGTWSDTVDQVDLPFTVACDLVYSDVYDRVMVPLGAEVWITPYIAARAGMRINHPSDYMHFGTGLRWSNIAFDFDYGITQPVSGAVIEPKWLFGLTYSLKSTTPKSPSMITLPPKSAPLVAEPKTFVPPKRILLTPKPLDSSKIPAPAVDTTSTKVPDSTKAVTDTSGMPLENVPVKDSLPGVEAPIPPMPVDSVAKPDPAGK